MQVVETTGDLPSLLLENTPPSSSPSREGDTSGSTEKVARYSLEAFTELKNPITEIVTPKGEVLECRLSTGQWESSTFLDPEEGEFHYVTVYSQGSETEPLIKIRFSEDHALGEWISIHKSKTLSGKEVVLLAEKISYAIGIKKCFLTDDSKVTIPKLGEIALRIPLWVIKGQGFYNPIFALANGKDKDVRCRNSRLSIPGTGRTIVFSKQNPKEFAKDLLWLQSQKMSDVYSKMRKRSAADQQWLKELLEGSNPKSLTLQEFMSGLYEKKTASTKGKKDYYWACHRLITHWAIRGKSNYERKFHRITQTLDHYMLHVASFAKAT